KPRGIRALSNIIIKLIQGYVKEERAISVDNLRHWPPDSNATRFLSKITSITLVIELIEHPLLQLP
ncbi:uncharacterized protein K441DRAFT_549754, partial [Cenococcum geophilum 1.58]|uniref:uncharacterized protein n=1 Tax=Cenococcum geophilum 1.58 TaxID=794803 RepID=UPI0035901CCC